MNEMLRRALFRTRLGEEDIAARLGVDPKTVRRWIDGRVPYPRHRWALADLLDANERDLWPGLRSAQPTVSLPAEIVAVYPHRWAVPRDLWRELFGRAAHKIDILAYSGLFLAEDADLTAVLAARASARVAIRIALGDPGSPGVAERGAQEGIDDAMAAKIPNALVLFRPLHDAGRAEIRLHSTLLYNSVYRADNEMLSTSTPTGSPPPTPWSSTFDERPTATCSTDTWPTSSASGTELRQFAEQSDHLRPSDSPPPALRRGRSWP